MAPTILPIDAARRTASLPMVMLGIVVIGCKADLPGKFETAIMNWAKHKILVNKTQKNPLKDNAGAVSDGREVFSQQCIACHGLVGQNAGVPFADRRSPPVPSLAGKGVQSHTDRQLKWIIDNGIRPSGMHASKSILSDDEIWSIALYLCHLPHSGILGEPQMFTH
jgi:mono/diheme cytochrome c family protein